ncbi:MAG: tRNA preQ1(34) S-adenosylmethionine ribosyltransferase-isomerase QueA [Planctomycetes bacterium]|nr:tRNA preQ1(34) S-adenosylmethionine ribosyltransferase-isomerase QueA [Planctomycetota bacterium]
MRTAELQYDLPPELIAQRPVEPRDASRLLVLDRATGRIDHRTFRDLGDYLEPPDCLVLNNTRVIPARFVCTRQTGGKIEALFLHEQDGVWRALLKPSARLRTDEHLAVDGAEVELVLVEKHERGEWSVRPDPPLDPMTLLARVGQTPLPPYVRRSDQPDARDVECYQTVYAQRDGAVAAPTAGLHFTPQLLKDLSQRGIARADVTLHVGVGTFAPIEVADLAEHRMHAEWYEITEAAAVTLRAARQAGGRITAVGTTSARVLESVTLESEAKASARESSKGTKPPRHEGTKVGRPPRSRSGFCSDHSPGRRDWTNLFIYPPYRFRNVDRLLTNFHLPGSTLLALVMSFATPDLIRAAYAEAIARRYRFYSYGDAMLIF